MRKKLNWKNKPSNFLGRNGFYKCSGIDVTDATNLNHDEVCLTPITSKNELARCHIFIPRDSAPEVANLISQAAKQPLHKSYYLVIVEGDVEPGLYGPFTTEKEMDKFALRHRKGDPEMKDGIYPLIIEWSGTYSMNIDSYSGGFFYNVRNHYECPCGCVWTDDWNCECNDRCPECRTECKPIESEELELLEEV